MEIFVCLDMGASQRARLEDVAGRDSMHILPETCAEGDPDPRFLASEVAFGCIPPAWVDASRTLRWLQLESTGVDAYIPPGGAEPRIMISNLAGFYAEPVAESSLAGILALQRGIDQLARMQVREHWEGAAYRPRLRLLAGSRVVLFGYGAINRRLEELLEPFECEVTAFASDWDGEDLDRAVREADIVSCAAPETETTRLVFDRRRIGLLKSDAIFVNYGRGSLVDESALLEALSEQRIAGANLDVTVVEPLSPGDPLWQVPNLLLTQHTGGGSTIELDRKVDVFVAGLERYRRGQKPANLVDFARGY